MENKKNKYWISNTLRYIFEDKNTPRLRTRLRRARQGERKGMRLSLKSSKKIHVRPDPSASSGVNASLSSLSVRPELVEGYEWEKFLFFNK
jgi:hypothetical protein